MCREGKRRKGTDVPSQQPEQPPWKKKAKGEDRREGIRDVHASLPFSVLSSHNRVPFFSLPLSVPSALPHRVGFCASRRGSATHCADPAPVGDAGACFSSHVLSLLTPLGVFLWAWGCLRLSCSRKLLVSPRPTKQLSRLPRASPNSLRKVLGVFAPIRTARACHVRDSDISPALIAFITRVCACRCGRRAFDCVDAEECFAQHARLLCSFSARRTCSCSGNSSRHVRFISPFLRLLLSSNIRPHRPACPAIHCCMLCAPMRPHVTPRARLGHFQLLFCFVACLCRWWTAACSRAFSTPRRSRR